MEKCPLVGNGTGSSVPDFCRRHCGPLWEEEVTNESPSHDELDDFAPLEDDDCTHDVTGYGSESLRKTSGRENRIYTVEESCDDCHHKVATDSYYFTCPNE